MLFKRVICFFLLCKNAFCELVTYRQQTPVIFVAFIVIQHFFWMLYCCGSREKGEKEHAGAEEALMSSGVAENDTPAAGMFETADMPELLPPSGKHEQSSRGSVCDVEDLQEEFNKVQLSHDSPQRRLGQRAPKLGQIGRSKRVVIEDEDLDNVLNNNGALPVPLSNAPS